MYLNDLAESEDQGQVYRFKSESVQAGTPKEATGWHASICKYQPGKDMQEKIARDDATPENSRGEGNKDEEKGELISTFSLLDKSSATRTRRMGRAPRLVCFLASYLLYLLEAASVSELGPATRNR